MQQETATGQGTVHGKTIELDHDLGFPEGQKVTVTVRRLSQLSDEERFEITKRLSGAWADEGEEFDEYIRQCRERRKEGRPELEP